MDRDAFRVLVVCTGNLNRSALGAALLRTWVEWYLPADLAARVTVTSAGTAAPVGRPMRRRTRAIAEALGASGSGHRARQLDESEVGAADLVLTADVAHRDAVLGMVPAMLRSTFTIREAGAIAADLGPALAPQTADELRERVARLAEGRGRGIQGPGDITDPQGKDDEAFRAMARDEVPPLTRLAAQLLGMPQKDLEAIGGEVTAPDAFPFVGLDPPPTGGRTSQPALERRLRRWFGRKDS
ncbi:hypothetical protein [Agromyces sp. SYSU T0242]|uniref:arsenate reductase/protein-tyrosine-phosphatase family protein n=1 Tax=Agromyces litoreus TaxID=3158561 RepID=UPI0033972782